MRKLTDGLHGITRPALSVPSLQNDTKLEKNKGSLCPQKFMFSGNSSIFESTGFHVREGLKSLVRSRWALQSAVITCKVSNSEYFLLLLFCRKFDKIARILAERQTALMLCNISRHCRRRLCSSLSDSIEKAESFFDSIEKSEVFSVRNSDLVEKPEGQTVSFPFCLSREMTHSCVKLEI